MRRVAYAGMSDEDSPGPDANGPDGASKDLRDATEKPQTLPPDLTEEERTAEAARTAQQVGRPLSEALKAHEATMQKLAKSFEVSDQIRRSFETSNRLADAMRPVLPNLNASISRMAELVARSAGTAKAMERIARLPTVEAPLSNLPPIGLGPKPEVVAMQAVRDEIRSLAEVAAATAESTGALAEVARESLQQTVALIGTVQQLHETTRAGIEGNDRMARQLVGAVDTLDSTTEDGLGGTRAAVKELVGIVQTLRDTTQAGIDSNAESTAVLLRWTRWLFILTAVLVIFTGALLYLTYRLLPSQ